MLPTSRRCLLCSNHVQLASVSNVLLSRSRSAVPAAAPAQPSTASLGGEQTVLEVPAICPVNTKKENAATKVKPYDEVPGPKGLPLLGSLLDYMGNGPYSMEKMHLATIDRFRQFGPVYKETLAGITHVHIIEPDDVKELIRHEGPTPRRITLDPMVAYRKLRKRNIGMSNLQGDEWRRLRKPFNHLLYKPGQLNTYLPKTEKCAEDFCQLIRNIRTPDGEVPDLIRQMQRWTLETLGSIVLDTRIGCMDQNLSPRAERVINSANDFINGLGDLMFGFPLYKFGIYTDTWKKFAAAQDFFFEFMLSYVQDTIEKMSREDKALLADPAVQSLVRDANFLETLLVTHSNSGPSEISDLLNDLLLGAIDTTSNMFSFIIYNLAKNPECQEIVHDEISRVLSPGEPVTPEALQMLPYLKACVKESTRLFPTIDGTSRILDKDITLSGYNIPANTIIRIHAVAGMMSEYVPEPEKFQPERWLRAPDRSILANPFLTIVFGVGFRGCMGKRVAEQQIYIGLLKLLQNFRLEWHHEDISLDFKITSRPSRPIQPKVIDRS